MTLHDVSCINAFAEKATTLFLAWDSSAPIMRRREIKNMVDDTTASFMVPPNVLFQQTGDSNGYFDWGSWSLVLRKDVSELARIPYGKFVTYCRTIYHETRHAEQFYRIAQGLAAGALKYPQKSGNQAAQAIMASAVGGVGSKIAMFSQGRKQQLGAGQMQLSPAVIAEWLKIPINVATAASSSSAQFASFVGGTKPGWFKRPTILMETEEWMRATYSGSLAVLNSWTQEGEARKMYRNQPEEHDAHEIGNAIVAAIDQDSGEDSHLPKY